LCQKGVKHMRGTIVLICILLVLSMAPWVVSYASPRPLLPAEFGQKRSDYQTAVAVAQAATRRAMSDAPSTVMVRPIGTLDVTSAVPTEATSIPIGIRADATATAGTGERKTRVIGVPDATASIHAASTTAISTVSASSVVTVRTVSATASVTKTESVLPTPTLATLHIVVDSNASPTTRVVTPVVSDPAATMPAVEPLRPLRLVDTQDVITEEMLTEQIRLDADDDSLSGLTIKMMPDGISGVGVTTFFPGIEGRIEARGVLAVKHDSLVVEVSSIYLDGKDVTEQYSSQLESGVNSSLYRLLPQRYVDSFEIGFGQVRVFSKVRP